MVKPAKLKVKKKGPGTSILPMRMLNGLRQGFFYSLPYILSLTVVGVLFGSVIAYAVNSPTFRLTDVKIMNAGSISREQAFDFCELRQGENLISLDLVGVQQVIKRKHPEFKEVKVRRVLPDRIQIFLKRRTPVAQALLASRFIQVDKDLVLLPGAATQPFRNLTVIQGSPIPAQGLYVGVTLSDASTQKAVKVADIVKQSRVLRGHWLTRIDITDKGNFLLIVDDQIEIRIGGSHFIERLKILDQTLKSVPLDPAKIKYIDLRFDDVVIGPR